MNEAKIFVTTFVVVVFVFLSNFNTHKKRYKVGSGEEEEEGISHIHCIDSFPFTCVASRYSPACIPSLIIPYHSLFSCSFHNNL